MSSKKAVALRSSVPHEKGDETLFDRAVKNRVPWVSNGREPLDNSVRTEGNFAQRYAKIDSEKENNYNKGMNLEDKFKLLLINDEKMAPKRAELLAKEFVMAVRGQPSRPQPQAENLSLPDHAPGIYAERKIRPDLGRKENPIEFLQRVWGRYMDAGVLYQDDIKRLGDPDLVKAVRGRCRDTGIDPKSVLPPPGKSRPDKRVDRLGLTTEQAEAVYLSVARQKMQLSRAKSRQPL